MFWISGEHCLSQVFLPGMIIKVKLFIALDHNWVMIMSQILHGFNPLRSDQALGYYMYDIFQHMGNTCTCNLPVVV